MIKFNRKKFINRVLWTAKLVDSGDLVRPYMEEAKRIDQELKDAEARIETLEEEGRLMVVELGAKVAKRWSKEEIKAAKGQREVG